MYSIADAVLTARSWPGTHTGAQSHWVPTVNAIHEVKLVVSLVLSSSDRFSLLLTAAVVDSVRVVTEQTMVCFQVLCRGRMVWRSVGVCDLSHRTVAVKSLYPKPVLAQQQNTQQCNLASGTAYHVAVCMHVNITTTLTLMIALTAER